MTEIWRWFGDDYRASVSKEQYAQLLKWKGVSHGARNQMANGAMTYDIQFSRNLLTRVQHFLNETQQ